MNARTKKAKQILATKGSASQIIGTSKFTLIQNASPHQENLV